MQCSGRDATRALAAWRDEANFSQRLQRGPDGGARAHHARRFLVNALAAGCSRNCIANTKSRRPSPTPSQQSDCSTHLSLCSVMPASALQSQYPPQTGRSVNHHMHFVQRNSVTWFGLQAQNYFNLYSLRQQNGYY